MPEFARNMAFVIGINNYGNGIPPLHNAVNDAKKLVEILREKHGYQVWVCLDQLATLKNLQDLFEKSLPQQVTADDRLLFYFAGHGIALNSEDGPAGYLIPQDAKLGDSKTYLPMTQVHESLSNLPCRHFLGIFDCCFAGAFRWSSTRDLLIAPEVIHQERYDRFIADPAWQVITSTAWDQKALDAFNLNIDRGEIANHSPFASALFEALTGKADIYPRASNGKLRGDGVITATELYLYLRDRVELATQKNRLRQTPGIWALNKHDKGEYIFLTPGHQLNLPPAPPLDESKNPYRGLQSFEEEDSDLFFGRTALVEKLHKFVTTNPLTVVLGASGSGKSSLVKAGLVPQLRKSTMDKWYILSTIRPGQFPLQALNIALKNGTLPEIEVPNASFGQAVKNLTESIKVWATNNPNSKLLLCIDQSEELITLCRDENERKEFFRQLGQAIATYPQQVRVVITLRSDFEPQLRDCILQLLPNALQLENSTIKNKWQLGRFIVPAMSRIELRQAIEKPVEARVMYFNPHSLVDQLIDEVADMPGALPLLSFALSEMYLKYLKRQREASYTGITIDRALTQADYEELGGVIQSLTQRADQEYKALVELNPGYEQTIRHVMLRMVALGGGELVPRQVPMSELKYPEALQPQVTEVIKRFSDARLLIGGTDAEEKCYVEPAHDALVRGWQRLQNWVKEEKNLRLQRRLTPAAVEWKSKQQADYLWHGDPYLDVLQKEVLNSPNNNWLNQVETEFVQRSIKQKHRNIRSRWGIAIALMLGLSGLTIAQTNAQIGPIRTSRQSSQVNLGCENQELDALIESLRAGKSLKQPLLQ
ncbi:caspase family protein [Scytonema tolypothrichoides VB-61278]|nr:caspase family protein [Scytonema tolypothrichoides VB-61278]